MNELVKEQGRQWGRHAREYDRQFLDPYRPEVVNPWLDALLAVPEPGRKTVIDLGCGTGPLLPMLVERFQAVFALDFAPAMVRKARARLGARAGDVTFLTRSMHELDDLTDQFDIAVAVNSLVMPDVRLIQRALSAIRACLKPSGTFFGVVPAMDAIHYHTMLLMDRALDEGMGPEEAACRTASEAEHEYYDFAFGRFTYQGLHQKFWQPFELEYRLKKAGFSRVELSQVLYPWDDQVAGGLAFADQPRSWDWSFSACP